MKTHKINLNLTEEEYKKLNTPKTKTGVINVSNATIETTKMKKGDILHITVIGNFPAEKIYGKVISYDNIYRNKERGVPVTISLLGPYDCYD